MHTTKHIKQSILILSFATLLAGCSGGSATTSTSTGETASTTAPTTTPTTTAPTTTPAAKAVHQGQVKDSNTGQGLADVTVSLGESTTTTDADGFYTLSNLTETEKAVVNFEKEGYFLGSAQIQIKPLSEDDTTSPNYLEYNMHTDDIQANYGSTEGIPGAHIDIDASTDYIDTKGNPYSGTITAELTKLDTTTNEGKTLFPGAFKGMNFNGTMVQFESYGLIKISLKDSNGNKLSLADNETATLGFDAISSLEDQNTIPLWYYDYEQGLWIEEGYAQLQEDGTYKGEISHLGTWSINRPVEDAPGIYIDRIVYPDGTPVKDLRVHIVGKNWISTDLSTDENGVFEIEVIPGEELNLEVYHYGDKYSAKFNGIIPAIASGEIVDNIK